MQRGSAWPQSVCGTWQKQSRDQVKTLLPKNAMLANYPTLAGENPADQVEPQVLSQLRQLQHHESIWPLHQS